METRSMLSLGEKSGTGGSEMGGGARPLARRGETRSGGGRGGKPSKDLLTGEEGPDRLPVSSPKSACRSAGMSARMAREGKTSGPMVRPMPTVSSTIGAADGDGATIVVGP